MRELWLSRKNPVSPSIVAWNIFFLPFILIFFKGKCGKVEHKVWICCSRILREHLQLQFLLCSPRDLDERAGILVWKEIDHIEKFSFWKGKIPCNGHHPTVGDLQTIVGTDGFYWSLGIVCLAEMWNLKADIVDSCNTRQCTIASCLCECWHVFWFKFVVTPTAPVVY